MKTLMCGLVLSLGIVASAATAEVMLNVDGEQYALSALMDNCKSITGQPEAQIACFNSLTQLLDEQSGGAQGNAPSVSEALEALRAVAQYQDDETGLSIVGSDCTIQIVYFNNYFHISRRNISTIDLYSAQFDASKLMLDQVAKVQGGPDPLSKGVMDAGATAAMWGGAALESGHHNFSAKSSRTTIEDYASEVVGQLAPRESQDFDFVLVHPARSEESADIWTAFETFVTACKG